MKLHIFYRHYNTQGTDNKNRPSWFDFEKCYDNLLLTLSDIPSNLYNLNIVYDGKASNWIENKNLNKFYKIQKGEDFKAFQKTCDIVKNDPTIENGELIYFLENDYMHVDGWLNKIIELFSTYKGLDYVSLYDHNDKYFLPMYDNLTSKVFTSQSHHWRTTPSTCGSFITTKQRFNEDLDILSTMRGDHHKWLWLNENRNRFVFSPLPGLSTHCMNGLLSPTVEWETI